jgi:hypothetical protein
MREGEMTRQITHVSIHQTSKVFALLYFCFSILLLPVGIVVMAFSQGQPQGVGTGLFLMLAPVLYGVVGYLGSALFGFIYNLLAPRVGGVEFESVDQPRAV